jgi:hypothetical protein
MPRFIIFVRATPETEATTKADSSELAQMIAYNKSVRAACILQIAEGLHTSSHDCRRIALGPSLEVTAGPVPARELVAGFWIWHTKDGGGRGFGDQEDLGGAG